MTPPTDRPSSNDRVEVQTRKTGPNQWVQGKIKEVVRGGAFVLTDLGRSNFYNWKEIKLLPKPAKPKQPAIGVPLTSTLGEVLASKPPPPVAPPAAPPPVTYGQPASVLNGKPGPKPGSAASPALAASVGRRITRRHTLTPIGNLFKAVRLQHGLSQKAIAQKLYPKGKAYDQFISLIELGDRIPNDEELLSFSIAFGNDLDELIKARDDSGQVVAPGKTANAVPRGFADGIRAREAAAAQAQPEPPVPAPTLPAAAPLPPPPSVPGRQSFALLVEAIERLVPMPSSREQRGKWMQLVQELFELSAE
jgi:transcriptional regulator with XRE-family HTH domain